MFWLISLVGVFCWLNVTFIFSPNSKQIYDIIYTNYCRFGLGLHLIVDLVQSKNILVSKMI